MSDSCRVLMIFPRFNPKSFWSYDGACELLGAKYPAAPLGMITLAALLPPSWDIRLVNRNTEELDEADLAWADIVMTGGMLAQQFYTLKVIELA
ncbi:MAG TPA: B12-binding domain-containing radical SAM protein, partial [Stellaceae bacterium]|nr:B12-binding domain-containing radical SAM protein [Stellaceae bacterium]